MRVYECESWTVLKTFRYDGLDIRHCCWSPDNKKIVSCHRNGEVVEWLFETE